MYISGSESNLFDVFFGFKFGTLGRRLLIIEKLFAIFFSQSYKFLVGLTVLGTASLRFPIVFGHFHLDKFTITPTFP